ncbi:MAG: TauD/TfdA family dioxygenase [Pseudonocardiaceae bacterium]
MTDRAASRPGTDSGIGRRNGTVPSELQSIVQSVDFVPERLARTETSLARERLRRDGAVILTGWPVEPDSVVRAATAILGTRLRELEKVQERTTENADTLTLHRDGAHVVVDIHDRLVRVRIADPDYALILCTAPAPAGGESFVVDGYRLIDRLRDGAPELYNFITTIDVDITSKWISKNIHTDLYRVPRVCRLVEWTRGGRMIVLVADEVQPAPRETQWDEHERLIASYADVIAAADAQVRADTTLAAGEILILDNYRCLHGVRAHEGRRTTHVLRCKSEDGL